LTPQIAQELAAPNTNGALISRMASDSEAYKVGIRPGDIITGFNGQPIQDQSQLFRMIADSRIGSTASIKILRQGRTIEYKVPIVQDSRKR
jgi:serine protease Do